METTDLGLATYLYASGKPLLKLDTSNPLRRQGVDFGLGVEK